MNNVQVSRATEDASGHAAPERAADCRARAGLYRLLGRCVEAEVDAALLGALRGELREPLAEAGVCLDPEFFTADPGPLLAALAEEFTCLFVTPGGVPPYASVFETGRMYQEAADRAERAYRDAGWRFQQRMSGEFPDHIGTMLSFVGVLYDAEAQALNSGDPEDAERRRRERESFMLEQLAPWGFGWCSRARKAAMHDFYVQILNLIGGVLWSDLQSLTDRKRFKQFVKLNTRSPVKLDYDADFRKASGL